MYNVKIYGFCNVKMYIYLFYMNNMMKSKAADSFFKLKFLMKTKFSQLVGLFISE